jgi:hypothetical protein
LSEIRKAARKNAANRNYGAKNLKFPELEFAINGIDFGVGRLHEGFEVELLIVPLREINQHLFEFFEIDKSLARPDQFSLRGAEKMEGVPGDLEIRKQFFAGHFLAEEFHLIDTIRYDRDAGEIFIHVIDDFGTGEYILAHLFTDRAPESVEKHIDRLIAERESRKSGPGVEPGDGPLDILRRFDVFTAAATEKTNRYRGGRNNKYYNRFHHQSFVSGPTGPKISRTLS